MKMFRQANLWRQEEGRDYVRLGILIRQGGATGYMLSDLFN